MRSRYSAYKLVNSGYLRKTWHPDTRPELNEQELKAIEWLRLEVIRVKPGSKKSIVEFKAYYTKNNKEICLHEVSLFKKVKNKWYYLDSENN